MDNQSTVTITAEIPRALHKALRDEAYSRRMTLRALIAETLTMCHGAAIKRLENQKIKS